MTDTPNKDPKVDVAAIARLANLSPTEEELAALKADMEAILAFASQLAGIDTPPDRKGAGERGESAFRRDTVKEPFPREAILAGAKTTSDGFITVPHNGKKDICV